MKTSDREPQELLTEAVIYDMDGTLVDVSKARRHVMSRPKDFVAFHREAMDAPANQWVIDQMNADHAAGKTVIVVTARREIWAMESLLWLERNGAEFHKLYMRPNHDYRSDVEVKRTILMYRILPGHFVTHATDDNPSVIDLWKEFEIPTTVVPGYVTTEGLISQ